MEEREDCIALQCRQYSASCREFSVRCQPVQLRSLSAATCSVWLAAYWLFVLTQNSMVLSAAIFITLIGLIVYLHFVKIDQESLLVIASLGIQMTSSYASGKENTTFIEMSRVKDVVINEAIYMMKCRATSVSTVSHLLLALSTRYFFY
ncbi:phosphatidylinositol N-acetylglucosaminyltransferase subunit H isoform X5 [Alligator sinensis]|uniref:Phosphatidylinositol N-acetylglucosaminyltransferase subunit H isoform X5 n=1 Tax=Alligator sinensis TaxID=38654 RepID=A0A3Q0GFC6_ALLSI|nr:phosphatidylinositol N-acetylglucosaminyltransferase subunit H isoform X5 [Alligator sinensis]